MSANSKEAILAAAKTIAQAHGYGGLNFRDLAAAVGIKAPSIYHHFASKAELGAAVAQRYREDSLADLDALSKRSGDPRDALHHYPASFRKALENGNRLCLCSFMAAEYDDLPDLIKKEIQAFADAHTAWLAKALVEAELVDQPASDQRAKAIFAAIAGAQLMARSRADIGLYDGLVEAYRSTGLLPARNQMFGPSM
jgi:TetR/AcrR family transcriptional regulator, transcriptional repressor for nem operon